jgi:hypothetical protein
MITWFFDKIGFYEILESKTCHFLKIMQIAPKFICNNTNYLWLPLITFIKCSPIVWRSHQCAHDVLIIFCASRFNSYMSRITFLNDILVELSKKYYTSQSSPHMTNLLAFHQICFTLQSCFMLLSHSSKEFVVLGFL